MKKPNQRREKNSIEEGPRIKLREMQRHFNSLPTLCEKCRTIVPKMTAAEVAAILKVSAKTVRNGGAGTDTLPREYYGSEVRFDKRAFEEWLERKRKESRERLHFAFAGHPKALSRVLARLGLGEPDEIDSPNVIRIKQYLAERKIKRRQSPVLR